MERDFMGLGSRDSNAAVKEETVDECKELDFVTFSKASSVEWLSSNKVSVPSHFMAFNSTAEENTIKAFPFAELQKDPYGTRKSPFPLPTYPDAKIFPISSSMSHGTLKSHFGGSTVLRPHPIHPSLNSVAGTAETRYKTRPSESPPQLTVFYGGMVNVFDNISPDKAESILFLAGSISAKGAQPPRPQTQLPPLSKHEGCNGVHFSPQLVNFTTPNYFGVSSPMSVSSHPIVQSGKDSRTKDEVMPIKPVAVLGTLVTRIDSPNIPASATLTPSAVPQARKASLARFLEKRKERVIGSAPYNIGRDSPECSTSELNGE